MAVAVQTLDISPVGRVEGDLDVRVDIKDGVVVNAWTQAALFRGFEVILRDKDAQAGLVVTPRACGICGASHLTCAAWALDVAWQTDIDRDDRIHAISPRESVLLILYMPLMSAREDGTAEKCAP